MDHLADSVRGHLPFGFGFDLMEHVDRRVELIARKVIRWMWEEMKENAKAASNTGGGASLVARQLSAYIKQHGNVKVHLVGHSAGAIFHAALLNRLVAEEIDVASMAFLAPAITVDGFVGDVLPHLGGKVRSFANFNLSDRRELDDVCGAGGLNIYHKSILYLVSRAFEGDHADRDVPILGMQKFLRNVVDRSGNTLEKAIELGNGSVIVSRSDTPAKSRSDASNHGGFAGDGPTMTSVLMRVLGLESPTGTASYRRNAALTADGAPMVAARRPAPPMAGVNAAGDGPLVETGETPAESPAAPAQVGVRIEVASSPKTQSPVLDILESRGWKRAS
jgi:pimeloyl-ACP methyl ester carboxylesterase